MNNKFENTTVGYPTDEFILDSIQDELHEYTYKTGRAATVILLGMELHLAICRHIDNYSETSIRKLFGIDVVVDPSHPYSYSVGELKKIVFRKLEEE